MSTDVVVLGAGYAGAGTISSLQESIDDSIQVTWVADVDYHLVLHEVHRAIRDPTVQSDVTIPITDIADTTTRFVKDRVTGIDIDSRIVELAESDGISYDYLLVALGSRTAYYGIPGLQEHARTLKNLDDALAIHDAVTSASREATRTDPVQVVVGGAGLSGIQTAGELAELRDEHRLPIEIHLVEALDEIFPGNDPTIQQSLRELLENAGVKISTDDPIVETGEDEIIFDDGDPLPYDILIWTGGITGRDALESSGLDNQHNRLKTDTTFQTSNEHIFAIGDSAIIDQEGSPVPPTAQAAWQAAAVAAENICRAIDGRSLRSWTFEDKGTVVSVGERAIAHDVTGIPIGTFGGYPAQTLKKFIAARWIASLTSWRRARNAWSSL